MKLFSLLFLATLLNAQAFGACITLDEAIQASPATSQEEDLETFCQRRSPKCVCPPYHKDALVFDEDEGGWWFHRCTRYTDTDNVKYGYRVMCDGEVKQAFKLD